MAWVFKLFNTYPLTTFFIGMDARFWLGLITSLHISLDTKLLN